MAVDIFIPDIHGDLRALDATLLHAGLAEMRGGKLMLHDPGVREIVCTGDYIDRGPDSDPQNLPVLERLMELRGRFRSVTLLPGNHELAAFQALTHSSEPQYMKVWMEGLQVLKEVADRCHLQKLSQPTQDAHPLANSSLPGDEATKDYLTKWHKAIAAHPDWQTVDFPAAYGRAQTLFIEDPRSPFHVLFRQMQVARRIGSILAVHAGMNEKGWHLGTERLQKLYELAWQRGDFRFLHDFDYETWKSRPHAPLSDLACMVKKLPPSTVPLLSEKTAHMLARDGIRILLHGHAVLLGKDIASPGVQQCNDAHGIADMNGDIGMSAGFLARDLKKPSDWGFIQYDEESGQMTAVNPKTGPLDFGTLRDGEYSFPAGHSDVSR